MYLKCFGIQACAWLLMSVSLYSEPDVERLQLPAGLVAQLSSDDFSTRNKAYSDLEEWSLGNLTASPELLHEAWKESDDPEVQTRCYSLMRKATLQREFGKGKGYLGIQMLGVDLPGKAPGHQAVSVQQVLDDTPAQRVGLRAGDLIVGVDEVKLMPADPDERRQFGVGIVQSHAVSRFSAYIKSRQPDDKVTLHLLRGGKAMDVDVVLTKLPPENDPDWDRREREEAQFFQQWLENMKKGEPASG